MEYVKAKKHLGQHFLKNDDIAQRIVDGLPMEAANVLEIGPGMGVLTKFLTKKNDIKLKVVEIDQESVNYLVSNNILAPEQVLAGDFLRLSPSHFFTGTFSVIGNFPYNISTQILFKVLENKDQIPAVVGMFQKEVAERIASGPGSRDYGIVSVLLQAYYDIEYLFTVGENEFIPPPKVKSGVIRLIRNNVTSLPCDEKKFVSFIKQAFGQRRKTMRNSLRNWLTPSIISNPVFDLRPEQLSVNQFVELTKMLVEENNARNSRIQEAPTPLV